MRSLEQWLAYQTQAHPQAIDLGLARLQQVLSRLEWRQPQVPVITIAGTNGKGSVAAYCAAILKAAGYRVGMFTSPHLRDYRERILIDDRWVSEAELIAAFEKIEAARGAISLTFFEFNALAAFLVFEAAHLDAWVLEIGMGGRLDAVNIVDSDVAVVVSIGLDHQEYLGNSIAAIAREKAGIFRAGRTAVIGGLDPPPALAEVAAAVRAPLKRFGVEYFGESEGDIWHYRGPRWNLSKLPTPALRGEAQVANAATAIAALEELQDRLSIDAGALAAGLKAVQLIARFQVLPPSIRMPAAPTWILDVAHNPDAARVLAQNLRATANSGKSFAVCGILADKDAAAIAAVLRDCFDAWWCASLEGARGRSGAALADTIRPELAMPLFTADSIAAACAAAAAAATAGDRIVVFGSFHAAGPALDWLEAAGLYTAPPSRH